MKALFAGLAALWCEWMHGGGWVLRDPSGRVNWQCNKCGRWAEPVSESDEADLLRRHMERNDMELPEPDAYVTDLAHGAFVMLEDPNDVAIAVYTAPTLVKAMRKYRFVPHNGLERL